MTTTTNDGAFTDSRRIETTRCFLEEASACFTHLFEHMPICSEIEITFRCQHFNVLDDCFREQSIMCLPSAIGQTAKQAYKRKLQECTRQAQIQKKLHHRNVHHQGRNHLINSTTSVPSLNKSHIPSELQFISLFGYLQTLCRRSYQHQHQQQQQRQVDAEPLVHSTTTQVNVEVDVGLDYNSSPPISSSTADRLRSPAASNCSVEEFSELVDTCETEIASRAHRSAFRPKLAVDLDRHQLLRAKLEASSRLLRYTETRREDECLMIRAVLSDIFQIHQKYCIQTTVTSCLCAHFHFDYFCEIECSNLEVKGLPFDQRLLWSDFKGRLTGSDGSNSATTTCNMIYLLMLYQIMLMIIIFI